MDSLESFKINLKAMKEATAARDFVLDSEFFSAVGGEEVRDGRLTTHLDIAKTAGAYVLGFHTTGEVTVPCDVCLRDMALPIDATDSVVVKMGDAYQDEGEEITIPAEEGVVDVAWLIYEFVALAVPTKHVHAPEDCDSEMLERLEHLQAGRQEGGQDETSDPRWKELEKLKTIFKD